jgi:hypothetical protein
MKTCFALCTLLFSSFTQALCQPTVVAGPILNPTNGSTYYLLSTSSWTDAQTQAKAMGGNLATIRNEDEHNFIYNTFGNWGGTPHHLWIGLWRTNDFPGIFRWVSGEPVSYTRWAPGEPNNCGGEGENRGIIFSPDYPVGGYWNDVTDSGIGGCGGGDLAPLGVVEVNLRATIAVSALDICWASLIGRDYQVEYRTNATSATWFPLSAPLTASSSNTCVTDPILGHPARFYRIRQLN